jgi:hypothetical protein
VNAHEEGQLAELFVAGGVSVWRGQPPDPEYDHDDDPVVDHRLLVGEALARAATEAGCLVEELVSGRGRPSRSQQQRRALLAREVELLDADRVPLELVASELGCDRTTVWRLLRR